MEQREERPSLFLSSAKRGEAVDKVTCSMEGCTKLSRWICFVQPSGLCGIVLFIYPSRLSWGLSCYILMVVEQDVEFATYFLHLYCQAHVDRIVGVVCRIIHEAVAVGGCGIVT